MMARWGQALGHALLAEGGRRLLALVLALFMAYGRRLRGGVAVGSAVRIAALGYAIPGTVIAVGVLIPFGWLDNAVRLLEFMVTEESQRWYAEVNHEYPVLPGVAPSSTLAAWGEFKADTLNLAELGRNNAAAVRLMDRAGWK